MIQVFGPDNHVRPKWLGSKQMIIKKYWDLIFFLILYKKHVNYPWSIFNKNPSSKIIYK
jgi:hypothetical protein